MENQGNNLARKSLSHEHRQAAVRWAKAKYGSDPVAFVQDYILDRPLYPWQKEELESLVELADQHFIAVAGCNASGKTEFNTMVILWKFITSPNCIVRVMTLTGRQSEKTVGARVLDYLKTLKANGFPCFWSDKLGGSSVLCCVADLEGYHDWYVEYVCIPIDSGEAVDLGSGSSGIANRSSALLGLHNRFGEIVIVFDECATFPNYVYDHAYRCLHPNEDQKDSGQGNCFIATSNPTDSTRRFGDIFFKPAYESWRRRHVAFTDIPNYPDMFATNTLLRCGEKSYDYRVFCLGLFPLHGSPRGVFSSVALDKSFERTSSFVGETYGRGVACMGIDISPVSTRKTCICVRYEDSILYWDDISQPEEYGFSTFSVLAEKVISLCQKYSPGIVAVDAGCSGNVFVNDYLRPRLGEHIFVCCVSPGARATDYHRFDYVRTELISAANDWICSGGCIPREKGCIVKDVLLKLESSEVKGGSAISITPKRSLPRLCEVNALDMLDAFFYTFYCVPGFTLSKPMASLITSLSEAT